MLFVYKYNISDYYGHFIHKIDERASFFKICFRPMKYFSQISIGIIVLCVTEQIAYGQPSSVQIKYDIISFDKYDGVGMLHYYDGDTVYFEEDSSLDTIQGIDGDRGNIVLEINRGIDRNSIDSEVEPDSLLSEVNKFPDSFIQSDFNDGLRLSFKHYNLLEKAYFLKEPTGSINWKLLPETKMIGKFECLKAVGKFGGRSYTVWYAPEIQISIGPWKLDGLPGVILEAVEDSNRIKYNFKNIQYNLEKPNVPVINPIPEYIIDCEEYIRLGKKNHELDVDLATRKVKEFENSKKNVSAVSFTMSYVPLHKECD